MLSGTAGPARTSLEKSGPGQSAYQVHDEDVTAATVHYLDRLGVRRRASRQGGEAVEPFSLSVGFMLPHQPYVASRADHDLHAGRVTMPRVAEAPVHPAMARWRACSQVSTVLGPRLIRRERRPARYCTM